MISEATVKPAGVKARELINCELARDDLGGWRRTFGRTAGFCTLQGAGWPANATAGLD